MKPSISWIETHHLIVEAITISLFLEEQTPFLALAQSQGSTAIWQLAESLTDEFESLHKDRQWDGEFIEEVERFIAGKLNAQATVTGGQRQYLCHWETDYYEQPVGSRFHSFEWFTDAIGYDSDEIDLIDHLPVNGLLHLEPGHTIIRTR